MYHWISWTLLTCSSTLGSTKVILVAWFCAAWAALSSKVGNAWGTVNQVLLVAGLILGPMMIRNVEVAVFWQYSQEWTSHSIGWAGEKDTLHRCFCLAVTEGIFPQSTNGGATLVREGIVMNNQAAVHECATEGDWRAVSLEWPAIIEIWAYGIFIGYEMLRWYAGCSSSCQMPRRLTSPLWEALSRTVRAFPPFCQDMDHNTLSNEMLLVLKMWSDSKVDGSRKHS